jgi:hypothetical protein
MTERSGGRFTLTVRPDSEFPGERGDIGMRPVHWELECPHGHRSAIRFSETRPLVETVAVVRHQAAEIRAECGCASVLPKPAAWPWPNQAKA